MLEQLPEIMRVEDWRLKQLIDADFPVDLATQLALRHDVDVHQALALVARGCTPELAGQILL